MSRYLYGFAVSALAVVSSACSSPTAPTASLTDRITGAWTLVAQQPAGEAETAPPSGSTFGFHVVDGRAAVTADCNRCNGAAAIGENTLTLGPALACTRAFCSTSAPFDTKFVQILGTESVANIDGKLLTLRSERGILRFRR